MLGFSCFTRDIETTWDAIRVAENDDFDPVAFMRQLNDATERAKAIAALRPPRPVLSEKLLLYVDLIDAQLKNATMLGAWDELRQLAKDAPDDLVRASAIAARIPWFPSRGSRSRAEQHELAQLGWAQQHLVVDENVAFDRVLFHARRLIAGSIDHLRAIGLLLTHDSPVRSPLALGRVALESGARAAHLLNAGYTAQQRVACAINIEISPVAQAWQATDKTKDPGRRVALDQEMQQIASIGARYGIARSSKDGRFLEPLAATSQTIEEVLADSGPSLHHDLSAVIHSQESDFQRAVFGLDAQHVPYNRTQQIALAVFPAILALATCLDRLRVFCDWTFDANYDRAAGVFLNVWASGSGLADEALSAVVDEHSP